MNDETTQPGQPMEPVQPAAPVEVPPMEAPKETQTPVADAPAA
jgi:hypothetical protein